MPSPLAHCVIGYAVYRLHRPGERLARGGAAPRPAVMLGIAVGLSLFPDVDAALGLLLGDLGAYHNAGLNSLFVGMVVSVLVSGVAFLRWRRGFRIWLAFALLCYTLHVLADFLTWGRGVMLFWPLTADRFMPPVYLFYGLHWSDGWISVRHIWTLLTELGFAAVVLAALALHSRWAERRAWTGAHRSG